VRTDATGGIALGTGDRELEGRCGSSWPPPPAKRPDAARIRLLPVATTFGLRTPARRPHRRAASPLTRCAPRLEAPGSPGGDSRRRGHRRFRWPGALPCESRSATCSRGTNDPPMSNQPPCESGNLHVGRRRTTVSFAPLETDLDHRLAPAGRKRSSVRIHAPVLVVPLTKPRQESARERNPSVRRKWPARERGTCPSRRRRPSANQRELGFIGKALQPFQKRAGSRCEHSILRGAHHGPASTSPSRLDPQPG